MVHLLHTATIGLSALLLFFVQPMISKVILPEFGGGSSVWLTSLVFFQTALLAGYASSHWLARIRNPKHLFAVYACVALLSFLFLPLQVRIGWMEIHPAVNILLLLGASIGLPYLLLSTTTPMVQYWIAVDPTERERNPYIHYAVSNAGSFIGLLAYPLLIEPRFTNSQTLAGWSLAFALYALLLLASGVIFVRRAEWGGGLDSAPVEGDDDSSAISRGMRLGWLAQAMIPAAALMAFTHYITLDLVNLPLLWVVPLCLYLASFVVCFLWPVINRPGQFRSFLLVIAVLAFAGLNRMEFGLPFLLRISAACVCLFGICLYFHGNLERSKPAKSKLTAFYLYLSLGGCLGGIFVGIVAPLVFRANTELNLIVILSLYVALLSFWQGRSGSLRATVHVLMTCLLVVSFINDEVARHSNIVFRTRSFFGSYTITDIPEEPGRRAAARMLTMGTTIHGVEVRSPDGTLIPTAYFHERTGVGQALERSEDAERIAIVGLGVGTLALYGRQGQVIDFYEIDARVVEIAETRFDILRASRAKIRHIVGDARIRLREAEDRSYDILVFDAFTSGAIPTHLLTLEAISEALMKLKEDGLLLFHISNRFVNLLPVLLCDADRLGLQVREHNSPANDRYYRFSAHWVAMTPSRNTMRLLTSGDNQWAELNEEPVCWTDDFSHLWTVCDYSNLLKPEITQNP